VFAPEVSFPTGDVNRPEGDMDGRRTGASRVLADLWGPEAIHGAWTTVRIGGVTLPLIPNNKHEFQYYHMVTQRLLDVDTRVFRRFGRRGDVVLDVGANIGFTALRYLEAGATQVVCFEPVDYLFRRLSALATDRIVAHAVALSDQDGEATMFLSGKHHQGSTLDPETTVQFPHLYSAGAVEVVRVARLDTLFPDTTFDFVKIDAEGSELRVLRGAMDTLAARCPRTIQLEVRDQAEFEDVDALLAPRFAKRFRVAQDKLGRAEVMLENGDPSATHPLFDQSPPIYVYTNGG
jgi:FkbM family methyltransferase